ncbi:MAG: glycine cleavage system protein GcvH [Planctomycetia bacterium]
MDEQSLLYAASHEWVHLADGVATVGISRHAVEQLTDIVYLELPAVGKKVEPGKPFGVVESVKSVSDLYSPVAGEVVEVNQKAVDDPAVLSGDPYGAGWMIRVRVAGSPDVSALLSKQQYEASIAAH